MPEVTLVTQILTLLPQITVGVGQLIAWIQTVRTAAQQSSEWTPAMETAFLDALLARRNDPARQPDP